MGAISWWHVIGLLVMGGALATLIWAMVKFVVVRYLVLGVVVGSFVAAAAQQLVAWPWVSPVVLVAFAALGIALGVWKSQRRDEMIGSSE